MIVTTVENRAGWILAGGRSSRMGTDKALIEIEGRPLALRIADELAKSCGSVSLVGDPALYGTLGLPVVRDTFPGQGPLAGIEAALGASALEWNLIVACDMPALDSATIESLFAGFADCSVPEYADGRLEPLCAVYRRRCHAAIRTAIESGIRRITDALLYLRDEGFAIRYVRVANRAPFANLNTPDEMRRYLNG
ncbi:MAG TPA: molybdenum cofactor guanylyltransferase [Bryobacteraceae bacterium]|nr:molybdenum cofactor guanylyltransferase [Bryobacteraceae bacterium]